MHTKECLAKAIICAVENIRDEDEMTDERFNNIVTIYPRRFTAEAMDYLDNLFGSQTESICICPNTEGYIDEARRLEQIEAQDKVVEETVDA